MFQSLSDYTTTRLIEERDQRDFGFCLWFLFSSALITSETSLALSFQVMLRNPWLISSDDTAKQVWLSFKTFYDDMTHRHTVLLLIIIHHFWHHFGADFMHVKNHWRWSTQHYTFSCLANLQSLEQSPNDGQIPPSIHTQKWLQVCLLQSSLFWGYFSLSREPLWISCASQKLVSIT